MNVSVSFSNLVRQLLPPQKRHPSRLGIVRAFSRPLNALFFTFDSWRSNTRMMVNVNSQVKIFEGYLRKKYQEPISIKIVTFEDGLLPVCLEQEGQTLMSAVGFDEEPFACVPLDGEVRQQFGDADFIVYLPASANVDLISAEVEKYKQALTSYKIIQR